MTSRGARSADAGAMPPDRAVDRRDPGILRRHPVVRRRPHRPVGPRRERDGAHRRRSAGPARAAFDWCRTTQRPDGSWPIQLRNGVVEDANSDSNFCAYIATGVWHHVLITGDRRFAETMWPVVTKAIDFVLDLQQAERRDLLGQKPFGPRARSPADRMRQHLPQHPVRAGAGGLLRRPAARMGGRRRTAGPRDRAPPRGVRDPRTVGRWSGTTRCSAARCAARRRGQRIDERWDDFVVPGLGIRCVDDRPWVTGAETCELVMALDAIGDSARAHEQFAAMHHLREEDGSYWTGLVFADGKRWPEERTTWTGAAMILAADALSSTTAASGIFRGADLPRGLEGEYDCACATSDR